MMMMESVVYQDFGYRILQGCVLFDEFSSRCCGHAM